MYRDILVCLDNSDDANAAASLAVTLACAHGARLHGLHVYAARLHNSRFIDMEAGLAPEYRDEERLKNTREVHDTLITKGLRIISDSYTAVFQAMSGASGAQAVGISREGRNFQEILAEAAENSYDLVALGRLGLGRTGTSRIGSVAERVARGARKDLLIASPAPAGEGPILVAIDGSPMSFGGLRAALSVSGVFKRPVEAVSAFDPVFHQTAFRSISGVLTDEAARVFRFSEQTKLHDEIIDKGLARIYRGHLETAERIAAGLGRSIKTTLLSGKASDEIIKYASQMDPFMAVFGRTGAHRADGVDIGATTENCLRELSCHVLVSSGELVPERQQAPDAVEWTAEAEEILEKIPRFARPMVRNMVEDGARRKGLVKVTPELMREVRKKMEGQ